jgi:hypothetical protein
VICTFGGKTRNLNKSDNKYVLLIFSVFCTMGVFQSSQSILSDKLTELYMLRLIWTRYIRMNNKCHTQLYPFILKNLRGSNSLSTMTLIALLCRRVSLLLFNLVSTSLSSRVGFITRVEFPQSLKDRCWRVSLLLFNLVSTSLSSRVGFITRVQFPHSLKDRCWRVSLLLFNLVSTSVSSRVGFITRVEFPQSLKDRCWRVSTYLWVIVGTQHEL